MNRTDEYINAIISISNTLTEKSFYDMYEPFFQFGFVVISVLLGALIGYFVSKKQSKKEFKKQCCLSLLKSFNDYLSEINEIIINISTVKKIGPIVCGNYYMDYQIDDISDYFIIMTKIKDFRYFLNTKFEKQWEKNTLFEKYFETLNKTLNDLLDFDLFVKITRELEKESINYYYTINKSLQKGYNKLIQKVQEYTSKNMQLFNIEDFKKELIVFIKEINIFMLNI